MGEVSGGGGGGGHKKGGAPKAKKMSTHIDMTPMVDLAFLLLTFFMLATTFNKPKAMEIIMPEEPENPEVDAPVVAAERVLNVLAGENNKLYWYVGLDNPQPVKSNYSPSGIRQVLMDKGREITARFPDKGMIVLMKISDKAKYKNMVDLFDEMNVTKQKSYALVPITPDEVKLLDEQP